MMPLRSRDGRIIKLSLFRASRATRIESQFVKVSNKVTLSVLVLLAAAGVVGLILTSSSPPRLSLDKNPQALGAENGFVDQQYLDTAQRLSALATMRDEQLLAQDALRITGREPGLQHAAARQAPAQSTAPQSPAVRTRQARITKIEGAIQAKHDEVDGLEDAVKKAKRTERDELAQQLDVSKAELDLYKEWLGDAKDDLIRAGGDQHSKVQQLVDEHEVSSHAADSFKLPPLNAAAASSSAGSLVAKWTSWNALRQKKNLILQAGQEAYSAAAEVAKNHDTLEQQLRIEQEKTKGAGASGSSPAAPGNTPSVGGAVAAPGGSTEAAVSLLKRLSDDRKGLAMLRRRIQNFEHLGSTYGQWAALVGAHQRAVLGAIIASSLWIILLLLLAFVINRSTEHVLSRLKLETKQRATLQTVIRIGVQVATVVVILIII